MSVAPFSDGIANSLAPWLDGDMASYVAALGGMFDPVYSIVADQGYPDDPDYVPGWSTLLDPDACPTRFLPYLAQFVGVTIPAGMDDMTARQVIKLEAGFQRGTLAAIEAAALRNLTGTTSMIGTVQELGITAGLPDVTTPITAIPVEPLAAIVPPQTVTIIDPTEAYQQEFLILTAGQVGDQVLNCYPTTLTYAFPAGSTIWGPFLFVRERWNGILGSADPYHLTLGFHTDEVPIANYVTDPDFEHDTAGSAPAQWIDAGTGTIPINTTASALTVQATGAQSGTQCLKVVTAGGGGSEGVAINVPNLDVGVTYTASCWLKGNAGGESMQLVLGYTGPYYAITPVTLTTSWQEFSVTLTVPTGSVPADIYFAVRAAGSSTVTFFMDTVMLGQGSSVQPFVTGDSASYAWGGSPGQADTYFAGNLLSAVNAVKPAGIIIDIVISNGWAWDEATGTWAADTFSWDQAATTQP